MRKRLTIQVEDNVHQGLALLAETAGQSLQAMCEEVLTGHVQQELSDPHVRETVRARLERQMAALGNGEGA